MAAASRPFAASDSASESAPVAQAVAVVLAVQVEETGFAFAAAVAPGQPAVWQSCSRDVSLQKCPAYPGGCLQPSALLAPV